MMPLTKKTFKRERASKPTMLPPKAGISVRLYDPGFGDCLLLAFSKKDGTPFYMLIDCGVHHLYPKGSERIYKVVKDIADATAYHLNVVVVTHEHTDHLFGFKYGREIFEDIQIDELWLAWTEDDNNPVAKKLKQVYGMRIKALNEAFKQLKLDKEPLAVALQNVLKFEFNDALSASGGKAAQLDYLRAKSLKKINSAKDYFSPKNPPFSIPEVDGIKIYVLGPPEDVNWIRKLTKESEMYPEMNILNEINAFAVGALRAGSTKEKPLIDEEWALFRSSCPFDESLEIQKEIAKNHPDFEIQNFFKKFYGFSKRKGNGPYWRRINTDWLFAAEQLALDINQKTNNTSLVFALELTKADPRKVLLFAADAQVGNWLSWYELKWQDENESDKYITVQDLLRRTVLYKVGHHGSRNATLSSKGLEVMESEDLVAMIPVDEKWAKDKMKWEHPADKLLNALETKTRGRIIRTDRIPPKKPDEVNEEEWKAFVKQLDWDRSKDKLWIQYTIF